MKNVYAVTGTAIRTAATVVDATWGGLRPEQGGLQAGGARRRVDATPTFEVSPVMGAAGARLGLRSSSPPIT